MRSGPRAVPLAVGLLLAGLALGGSACRDGGAPGGVAGAGAETGAASGEAAAAAAFRDRVLAIVAEEFPGESFETSVDPEILRREDAELHLGNLRAKCDAAGGIDACRGVVRAHFASVLASLAAAPASAPLSWEAARPRLRPQLAPAEYRSTLPLAHEPFAAGLIVAFVVDDEASYSYVVSTDLDRWGVELAELSRVALENLETASREIPVQMAEGGDRLLAVETGDGYDATRLLLPGFRRFAEERLGGPYFAAIPSRDSLVLWAQSVSPEFDARVRRQVAESFRSSPYPLTERRFVVGPDGVVPLPE